ncbi:MAG: NADH-ubiquinone oxidoreductase-F iron-sulfur binding region domain-containing protein [Planctomycetota bacterium]|nr:NADH-ubiquinone oxidoreductase-F iron-sulfur binding region domain-containing protein [Planctomycetota bacterium]
MIESVEKLHARQDSAREAFYPDKIRIGVGLGTCGLANGGGDVLNSIREEVEKQGLDFVVHGTGCVGFCEMEPLVDVLAPGLPRVFYHHMSPDKARELVASLADGDFRGDLALMRFDHDELLTSVERPLTGKLNGLANVSTLEQTPFYKSQMKIAIRNCGFVDPHNIEEYLATGGYSALAKTLTAMQPEEIIDCIEQSGLRGRGGGGFATGRKWRACRKAEGYPKYVLCNGDEGDPGAFMDRSIMEGNPHAVLEGMVIGAYAIGSNHGYIYVRLEYPLAINNLRVAIRQAEELGLLGENIMGTNFSFKVQISRGAGAFVCGESTALMASIEGFSGEPRAKHIHTSEKGLFGKPTNLNNVETWANVPVIIEKGADWFAGIGNESSKGTKVFSLVGKINNTGLVEVPMGTTLREIIFNIGGGVPGGRKFKAVQTGGPSGGCLPESQLDLPVDFEKLTEAGSMMGSGGMIVMDDRTCVVEVARYFTDFLRKESCGKCTACREGVLRMYEILEKITCGKASPQDVELLEEICVYVRDNSICGLGKSAPNPTLSTLKYFRDEYMAHVTGHKCPAGVCKALTTFEIDPEKCKACGLCAKACPTGAISGGKKKVPAKIDQDKCVKCGLCREVCKFEAVATT